MLKSKMELLRELFEEWRTDPKYPIADFYADGIINESLFDGCPPGDRTLVITKEPNANNHDQTGDRSFITEWDNKQAKYPFACRIGEWANGILRRFPAFDDITDGDRQEHLRKIAFMNVKKSGGKGSANRKDLYDQVRLKKEFITREIEIIHPDIIILGLSFDQELIYEIFGGLGWINSGYSITIAQYKWAKVINFYHPSSRNVPAASYSLLQNVIRSDAFRDTQITT